MAIINNLSASLVSFKVNDVSKSFQNSGGTYNTPDLLNGGETYDESTQNILSYGFKVQGLQDHTIKNIIVQSLLLTSTGDLSKSIRFSQTLDGVLLNSDIQGSSDVKTFSTSEFKLNKYVEDYIYEFNLELQNKTTTNCIYCLKALIINLQDINYKIHISFTGPITGRNISKINVSTLLQSLDAIDITFSKDPTKEFDKDVDSVEGRAYFKKNGIFVDGYQYAINTEATETKQGVVKLSKSSFEPIYEEDEEGNQIQVGIEAPTDIGVAASPQLVYNALASAINYTDEVVAPIQEGIIAIQEFLDGIDAPLDMTIEDNNGEEQSLGEKLIFSNDFEQRDSKLYINWLEIS